MSRTYRKYKGKPFREGKPPRYKCRCDYCINLKKLLKGYLSVKNKMKEEEID